MIPDNPQKLLFQSDFDGTITVGDISFLILDRFARGDWRSILEDYKNSRITVGEFNKRAFALVSEERSVLEDYVIANYELRPGFKELVSFCDEAGIRFVIISNGLDFYIRTILKHISMDNIKVFSARTTFGSSHLETEYFGPDGNPLNDGFKEAFSRYFIASGYDIIYAGNGASDAPAAHLAHKTFATESLVAKLKETGKDFHAFEDMHEIIAQLKKLL
ncbi:MAG: HAD-IB family phosphatase [Dehalococcoidales bacterium]